MTIDRNQVRNHHRWIGGRPKLALFAGLGAVTLLAVPAVALAQPAAPTAGPGIGQGCGGKFRARRHRQWARRGRGGPGGLVHGRIDRITKHLNLTPTQVGKLKALRTQHFNKVSKLRLQMQRIRAKQRVEWLAKQPNGGKLRTLHLQAQKVKTELANERFNFRLQLSTLLTADQRAKMRMGMGRHFRGKARGRRGGRRGKWGRRGQGGGFGGGRGGGF